MENKKIKVMLVLPSLRKTGVTEVIKSLLIQNYNSKNLINFVVLSLKDGFVNNESVFKNISQSLYIFKGNSNINLKKIILFRNIIQKEKPQIIHFNGFVSELYIPFASTQIRITTAHNMGREDFVYSYGHIVGNLISTIQQLIYKRVDVIVGVSKSVTTYYHRLGFHNCITIENGVEVPPRRNKLNLKGIIHPVGIYVGNIEIRKNVTEILKVFKKLEIPSRLKGTLLIIGDNPKNKSFFSKIVKDYKDKSIIFTGRVNNVFDYLSLADYYVSASKSEGLPMSVIEAMSQGLDLILSNIPQHKELKKCNDQNIYYFSNSEELKRILKNYYYSFIPKRNSMNENVFSHFYSANVMFNNYLDLYKQLLIKVKDVRS